MYKKLSIILCSLLLAGPISAMQDDDPATDQAGPSAAVPREIRQFPFFIANTTTDEQAVLLQVMIEGSMALDRPSTLEEVQQRIRELFSEFPPSITAEIENGIATAWNPAERTKTGKQLIGTWPYEVYEYAEPARMKEDIPSLGLFAAGILKEVPVPNYLDFLLPPGFVDMGKEIWKLINNPSAGIEFTLDFSVGAMKQSDIIHGIGGITNPPAVRHIIRGTLSELLSTKLVIAVQDDGVGLPPRHLKLQEPVRGQFIWSLNPSDIAPSVPLSGGCGDERPYF